MIRDFGTGMRWIIQRDGKNPGWPAKLVRISGGEDDAQSWIPRGRTLVEEEDFVREGDLLAISEETASFKAVLEGVALSSGVAGDVISVRLRFSGRTVRAQVVSRGVARLVRAVSEGR